MHLTRVNKYMNDKKKVNNIMKTITYKDLLVAAITQGATTKQIISDLETLIKLKEKVNKNKNIKEGK